MARPLQSVCACLLGSALALASFPPAHAAGPPEPGNLRLPSATALTWNASAGAVAYHVYRGDVTTLAGGQYGICQDGNVEATTTQDLEKPGPGGAFFYLVSAMNEGGESAAGHDSAGAEHSPATHCIPARRLFALTENGVNSDGVIDGQSPRRGEAVATALTVTNEGRDRLQIVAKSGEVDAESVDLTLSGRKPGDWGPLYRSYHSQIVYDGPLGVNWDFSDNMRIARAGGDVVLLDGSGRRETFHPGAGGFVAPPGLYGKLLKNGDGSYTLRSKGIVKTPPMAGSGGAIAESCLEDKKPICSFPHCPTCRGGSWSCESCGFFDIDGLATQGGGPSSSVTDRLDDGEGGDGPAWAAINSSHSNIKNLLAGVGGGAGGGPAWAAINSSHSNIKNLLSGVGGGAGPAWAAINSSHSNIKNLLSGVGGGGGPAWAAINSSHSNIKNLSSTDLHAENAQRYHTWLMTASLQGQRALIEAGPFEEGLAEDPGVVADFDARGRIVAITDQTGDKQTYLYDKQSLLRTVVDALGRSIQYDYDADGRISSITDWSGRQVRYLYSGSGAGARLIEVQRPVGGGLAPSRTLYTYTSGNGDPRLNNNLLTITTPAQSAIGGAPTVQLVYGAPGTFQADRVTAMNVGCQSGTGFPAGGTYQYAYSALNPGADPSLVDLPRRRCSLTDPLGNLRQLDTNAQANLLTLVEQTNRELRPGEPDYTTQMRYNADGELVQIDYPQGNHLLLTYDRPGADRYREGNVLEVRSVADTAASGGRGDGFGGEAQDLVWTFTYEPLFNQVATQTSPKGNDPTYAPPNGGAWSAARYTATRQFDYQEGNPAANGVSALAAKFGIALGAFPLNLGDLNGDGRVDQAHGARLVDKAPPVLLSASSHQAAIEGGTTQPSETIYRYNDFGQLIQVRDAESNVHQFVYYAERDPDGDGVSTPNPPDGRTLSDTDGGLPHFMVLDASSSSARDNHTDPTPAAVRHDYQYDALGRLVRHVDGRGVATRFAFNDADEPQSQISAAATRDAAGPFGDPPTGRGESGLTPLAYRTLWQFDRDGNLTKISTEDRDNTRGVGTFIDTTLVYDILGELRRIVWPPVPSPLGLTTQFDYDANGNLIQMIDPAGARLALEWDERGLLLSSTSGAGTEASGRKGYTYYASHKPQRITDELNHFTDFEYDGHDRLVRTIDAVGGKAEQHLDPDSDNDGYSRFGQCSAGSASVLLAHGTLQRDERGRVFRVDRDLFVPAACPTSRTPELTDGGLTPGDNRVSTAYEYDRLGRSTFTTSDTLAVLRSDYDGLSRIVIAGDVLGDQTAMTYDGASNLVETIDTEVSSVAGPPPLTFITTSFYDALDRRTMTVDNAGQTQRFVWNSASDLGATSDANGPGGGTIQRRSPGHTGDTVAINGHGNVVRYTYDSLGRRTRREAVLTASGLGDGTLTPPPDTSNPFNADGLIVTQYSYDPARLSSIQDDNGHVESYQYDARNRRIRRTADDGTFSAYEYDAASRVTAVTDPNGTRVTHTYDALDRRTQATVTRAPGVEGTTQQTFEYDGFSRLTRTTDNNDPAFATDDSNVRYVYDSLGRRVEEQAQLGLGAAPAVTSRGFRGGLITEVTLPALRRVEFDYDAIDRCTHEREMTTGLDVEYRYFGGSRVHTIATNSGLKATALNDAGTAADGIDAAGRIFRWRQLSGPVLLAGFEYGYDRAGRTLFERRLHDPAAAGSYTGRRCEYDSAGRLRHASDGAIAAGGTLVGGTTDDRLYTLDGRANWNRLTRNGIVFESTPNNLDEYDENQSGGTRFDDGVADDFLDRVGTPPDGWNLIHDKKGNETDAGPSSVAYDFAGRAVRVTRDADSWTVGRYAYDASGRRIRRETSEPGQAPQVTRYLHDADQVVEERDGSNAVVREYVVQYRESDFDFISARTGGALVMFTQGTRRHLIRDADGKVVAAFDEGFLEPRERVVYDPQGKPTYEDAANHPKLDAGGAPKPTSDFGITEGFKVARPSWGVCRYDSEYGRRAADPLQDWSGAYACEGGAWGNPPYDPNKGRALARREKEIQGWDWEVEAESSSRACGGDDGSAQRQVACGCTFWCTPNHGPWLVGCKNLNDCDTCCNVWEGKLCGCYDNN